MKALVLAAGLGTRLRPLTERWPKPAMPFLGRPLLRYTLAVLRAAGVTSVGFNLHHLPEVMESTGRAETARLQMGSAFVHEAVIQGTGGGIRGLQSFLSTEELFVVFNGDILFTLELLSLLAEHRASGAAATLLLLPMPQGETYAAVETDAGGAVRRIAGHGPGGKHLHPWHFTGVHLMSPAVFDFMRPGACEDINRDVYPRMMEKGLLIRGSLANGYWSDLGTPSRYLSTQRDLLTGSVPLHLLGDANPLSGARAGAPAPVGLGSESVLLDIGARVSPSAQVGPNVYLGENSRVDDGARVSDAAIFADTQVRSHEALSQVIAWGDQRLGVKSR